MGKDFHHCASFGPLACLSGVGLVLDCNYVSHREGGQVFSSNIQALFHLAMSFGEGFLSNISLHPPFFSWLVSGEDRGQVVTELSAEYYHGGAQACSWVRAVPVYQQCARKLVRVQLPLRSNVVHDQPLCRFNGYFTPLIRSWVITAGNPVVDAPPVKEIFACI